MVPRNTYYKSCKNFDESHVSHHNIIPPWCSSGKVNGGRKLRHTHLEADCAYPIRENIWEYLYDDCNGSEKFKKPKKNKAHCKHATPTQNSGYRKGIIIFTLITIALGLLAFSWMYNEIPKLNLINNKSESRLNTIITIMEHKESKVVTKNYLYRIRYLEAKLFKAKQVIRNSLRQRRPKMLAGTNEVIKEPTYYINGATAVKSDSTLEWDGRLTLWGVVPLWTASRPPDNILSLKKPTPGDCWPFRGNNGELKIELPQIYRVSGISIEHVHPDTTRSAPKDFVAYGVQTNDTWTKLVQGRYDNTKSGKQYYYLQKNILLKKVILHILTNHGNMKYTCVYRIHVYSTNRNILFNNKPTF